MIEINLLPEELKPKTQPPSENLNLVRVVYFIPLIIAVFIIVHLFLGGVFILKNVQLAAVNSKWHRLEPKRKALEEFKKEYENPSGEAALMKQLGVNNISWAEKLNKLSLDLPAGIWFSELTLTKKSLVLKCSVVSLAKEEMTSINKFIDNLEADAGFFKDFSSIELGSIERRSIAGYDIVDFIITLNLK